MLTATQMADILFRVSYPGWSFRVYGCFDMPKGVWLQGSFQAPCSDRANAPIEQKTRKWILSRYMTPSEVVQTALKCLLTGLEHEAREHFRYRGERVFGPHFDIEALVEIARAGRLDVRP